MSEKFNYALGQLQRAKEQRQVKEWRALRRTIGANIDPDRVEVHCAYAQVLDPYQVCRNFTGELYQIGREYFARSPGSDPWVSFDDLPQKTVERLWQRMRAGQFDRPRPEMDWASAGTSASMWTTVESHGIAPNKTLWEPSFLRDS